MALGVRVGRLDCDDARCEKRQEPGRRVVQDADASNHRLRVPRTVPGPLVTFAFNGKFGAWFGVALRKSFKLGKVGSLRSAIGLLATDVETMGG